MTQTARPTAKETTNKQTLTMTFCKKIIYREIDAQGEKIRVLLGQVLEESQTFVKFRTGKGREYLINKDVIMSLQDTGTEFIEEAAA